MLLYKKLLLMTFGTTVVYLSGHYGLKFGPDEKYPGNNVTANVLVQILFCKVCGN